MQKNSAPESDGELSPSTLKETYPVSGKNLSTLLPWITLLLSLAATVIAWKAEVNNSQRALQEGFDRMASQAKSAIQHRLTRVELALLGAKGFVETSGGVTRKQWREYVGALKIEEAFPGIQGIGFAVRVPAEDKAEHEEKIRNEGFLKYGITPPGARAEYYPIIYLEPFDWRNQRSFGYDMFSEPVRREAMERSRRQGGGAISGKVILVQETEKDRQNGFLMYVPVYAKSSSTATQAERERTHIGFAYAPFRMNNFMKGALEGERHWIANPDWLDIEINDGRELKDEALLFDSDPEHIHQPGEMASVMPIEVYGHVWTLRCNPKPAFIRVMYKGKPEMVLIGGLLFSLLIFGITWSLANTKRHAETLARRMSDDLRRSMNDVRALLDSAQESMFLMEVGGELISLNETAARRFGKTPDEMVGKNIYDFMSPELAAVRKQREAEAVRNRSALTIEDERSGRVIRTTLWPVVDNATGEVARVAAFSIDVTERHKWERELQENRILLRRTLDSLMDAVFVLDASTVKIKEVNKAATDIFGYQADELIGRTTDFLHVSSEAIKELRKNLYPAIKRQGYFRLYDFNMKRKDGSIFPTEISIFPLEDEQGRRVALVGAVRDISKVKEAEERFRLLFNSSNDAIFVHAAEESGYGKFIEVNDIACQRMGYSREELLNMSPADFDDTAQPHYAEDMARIVAELKSGNGVVFERIHMTKDGRSIPVEINSRRFLYGNRMEALSIVRDITERKKAEETLRRSAQDVRGLLDATEESLLLVEPGGVVIALNETAAKRLRKTPDEIVGRDIYDFMPPESAGVRRKMGAEAIRTRTPITFEDERSGRIMRSTLWPVVDSESGEVVRVAVFSIDVTERHKWERELQESRQLLRRTLDSLPDAVFVIDADTRTITEANKAATDIFGYATEEFIGQSTQLLQVSPESLNELREKIYPALDKQGYFRLYDFDMKRKDGSIFPTETRVVPLEDEYGRRVAMVGMVRDISKVKEAEERFRLLFNSGSDAIVVHYALEHGPGKIIEANDIACQRLGYTREELLNMTPIDFNDTSQPHYAEDMARIVAELKSGREARFERVHVAKDGRHIPVEINSRQFMFRGKPTVLSIVRDITERKKAEESIREGEARFRLVADSAPVLIWMSGLDAKCSYFNKGWLDFTGRPLEDELGDGWAQGVHPHDRARCVDSYMAAFDARSKFSIVYRLWRKDGQYRWVLDNGIPRFSPSGDFMGYIGSCIDITDRKEAEEALARSEKKIRDITAVIGQGVYALDTAGRLTFMNPEAERLLGWAEAEVLGHDVHRLFHGKREDGSIIKRGECPAHIALGTGQPQLRDGELLTKKDGGMFPASIVASPMMQEEQVAGVVVVFSDITERQRIMREIMDAKEQAERATELKNKFVSLVAHDLRSPFTAILGLMEILRNDQNTPLSASHKEIVSLILESGKTQVRMIDNLLTLSRLQADKIIPQKRFLDAWGLVQSAIDPLIHLTRQKDVGITNQVPHNAWLYADPDLFHGVIHNLLSNAIKFCRKGDSVTVFQPAGLPAALAVRDTGVGINSSILPHLFSSEVKTTTHGTLGERGSGLGLPLSFNIMTAHGGSISAENPPEGGSSFTLTLPYIQPLILLVDDEEIARTILNHSLIGLNANVIGAGSVDEAVELIRRNRPNLVIADIQMPGKNGFDLLTWITKNAKGLPVMMLTTDSSMATREEAFRLGANDFVTKPVNKNDLIPRARSLILSAPS